MNFSCPLNAVESKTKEGFLKNNPLIHNSWETKKQDPQME